MVQPKKSLARPSIAPPNGATRQDSIKVKEDSQRILKEYLAKGYVPTNKPFPKETLDETLARMKAKKGTTELIRKGVRDTETYDPSEFRTPIDENQFRQRESASGVLNMDIEPALYDKRIAPTSNIYLMGQGAGTYNDGVNIPSYGDMEIAPETPVRPKVAVVPKPALIPKVVPKPITAPTPVISKRSTSPFMETITPIADTLSDQATGDTYRQNQARLGLKSLGVNKMANGGRMPLYKRHIAPSAIVGGVGSVAGMIPGYGTAIQAGLGVVSGFLAKGEAEKEQKELERKQKQELYNQRRVEDTYALDNYLPQGEAGVQYYANGGNINSSTSKGRYLATGGDLIPLNSTTEEVDGNTHGSNAIDGQYGVTLNNGQQDIAEVEDKEIIKDNEKVYSARLMYNKNQSFADKAKQIAKKTAKLETSLDKTNDTKNRNGIERSLAGMKMADEALFNAQEQVKQIEGEKELQALGTPVMATGGPIPKLSWLTTAMQNPQVTPAYTTDVSKGLTRTGFQQPGAYDTEAINPAYSSTSVSDVKDPSFLSQLAPNLIDNVGNLILNSNTPKLPSPIYDRAADLETTVNVNPELAEIAGTTASTRANILGNTSDSNIARANIAQSNLRGLQAKLGVLGQKGEIERGLRNQSAMNRQGVARGNTDIQRQANMLEFQRRVEMQGRTSANLADLASNIKEVQTRRQKDDYYDIVQLADLLDDPTGEKARAIANNPELIKRAAIKKGIQREALRRAGQKPYSFGALTPYQPIVAPKVN